MELKALLQKANAANSSYQKYIAALEAEMAVWRSGGSVAETDWTTLEKAASGAAPPKKAPAASPTPSSSRSMTPGLPAIEGLKAEMMLDSRPQTPTVIGLDKDERDDFLRRENELSDQLAERELALTAAHKLVGELKEELGFLKEAETSMSGENKTLSGQLNELRLQAERLTHDNKEAAITIDILREQAGDAKGDLEELRKQITELRAAQVSAGAEDKEKKKQEKMAVMMAKFDTQGAFSEKDEQLRTLLSKLDALDGDAGATSLSAEDITAVRRHLADSQTSLRETQDRMRNVQEENEVLVRRREALEERVQELENEYEELLEKTINDDETSNVDIVESMADLKVRRFVPFPTGHG
jgi:kinesin family protein 5